MSASMGILLSFTLQTASCLVGLLVGSLIALAVERHKQRRQLRRRATVILRSIALELEHNHHALEDARPVFRKTPWGKSFYLDTAAWDTALSAADLPNIIGFRLTDILSEQYGTLVRIRHYLGLLTQLWMAPRDIEGYDSIQRGFHQAIGGAMDEAIRRYQRVSTQIRIALDGPPKSSCRERQSRLREECQVV